MHYLDANRDETNAKCAFRVCVDDELKVVFRRADMTARIVDTYLACGWLDAT
jgi:hypothetical protein